ncbi:unnamed protein product [Calicophoron daubneyi]|uniref:protein-tyrosine-phosphatase n=1 Tax=Calicophoron daubneyi TaxID=300641 RepID=A0AAV2T3R5_CALDB
MKHFHFTNSPVTPGMIRPFHCLAAVGLFMFMGVAVGMGAGAITLLVYGFLYWTPVETDKAELSSQDDLASAELNFGVYSPKWISITKFASFVDGCEADHYKLLFDQFTRVNEVSQKKITSGQLSFTEARKPENHALNRYTDILPYDQTRVILGDDHYINASKIYEINFNQEGLPLLTLDRRKVSYIATQAPLSETCGDFWRMIYENKISIIVALTGLVEQGRRKAFQYWPRTLKSTFTFSSYSTDFAVSFTQEISFASYTIRKFTVTSWALRTPKHQQ